MLEFILNRSRKKLLLITMVAMLFVSLLGVQWVNAAKGENATAANTENKSSAIDPANLQDGTYYIDYEVLYADKEKTSISAQYLVSPALLKVDDGKKSLSLTVLQSKEIVGFKIDGQEGVVSKEDKGNNTRVVTFQLDDLTRTYPAWISIHWIVEAIDFKYIHSYDIRFKLLPETIVSVEADAPVPTKDGTVGFPSGLNASDAENINDSKGGSTEQEANTQPTTGEQTGSVSFKDVENHWAKAAITRATELGIAAGHSDGTFRPDELINRSQFAVMLSRALKLPASNQAESFIDQKDIPSWAIEHVNAAVAAKLMSGYSDQTFRGDKNITRAEIAVIIARAANLNIEVEATLNFIDKANIPAWAQKEVAAAVQAGLISGKSNHRFEPSTSATRAEALTLIMRLLDKYGN